MTVRNSACSFDQCDRSLIGAPVFLFVERTPPHHVRRWLLYHQVLGRLHHTPRVWRYVQCHVFDFATLLNCRSCSYAISIMDACSQTSHHTLVFLHRGCLGPRNVSRPCVESESQPSYSALCHASCCRVTHLEGNASFFPMNPECFPPRH